MYIFGKTFMRQDILRGAFLCNRVLGLERLFAHSHHFPSEVPPGLNRTTTEPHHLEIESIKRYRIDAKQIHPGCQTGKFVNWT